MTAVLIDTRSDGWRDTFADAVAVGQLSFDIRGSLVEFLSGAPRDAQAKIVELDCSHLNILLGNAGVTALARATHLSNLIKLKLGSNRISDAGVKALVQTAILCNLTTLDLHGNNIGDAGAQALADATHLCKLSTLNLRDNQICTAGATALVRAAHLGSLIRLELGLNHIGNAFATALAQAPHFSDLTLLDLRRNSIGELGAEALARAAHLRKLDTLDLGSNEIGDQGIKAMAAAAHFRDLTTLDLSWNRISDAGAMALAESEIFGNLNTLNLDFNRIGDSGAIALAAAPHFRELFTLSLYGNEIFDNGAAEILLSTQLTRLHICEMHGNYLTAPEFALKNIDVLRRHYRAMRVLRRAPNKQVRAMVLGAPAAGKSIIARLLANGPETAPNRTLGIDPHVRPYPNIVCEVEGQRELHDLQLDIWDLGGQSLQQMMHGLFLQQSQINLLVMRNASERDAVRAWLDQLRQQATSGKDSRAALVPVINGFPDDSQAQMQATTATLEELLVRHGRGVSVQPATEITTISNKNDTLTRTLLDNKITAALTGIKLPTYFEPVARLRPLIESGLTEPCYDMRDLRRLLRENPSFQQEHGLLTEALLSAEGAGSEAISADDFAGMLITYLEQAGVVAVFRRDGDGIYDGLMVRDSAWIQKGLYSLLPPMTLEDDVASPERDTFAAKLRSASGRERLPGVFTEDDIRPVWKSFGIAEADQALLLNILTRKELGQLIRLDDAVYDGSRRYFVPAYLEEIGTETPIKTLDRLADSLTKATFASCWSLPEDVHWPPYFIYRLMVTIHGTPVHRVARLRRWQGDGGIGPFTLAQYAQRRCVARHEALLPGVALHIQFADDKVWCLAIDDRPSAGRRDYEPAFVAIGAMIETALGNVMRPNPGAIRSLLCPKCVEYAIAETDSKTRRARFKMLGTFDFEVVNGRGIEPTLNCSSNHKPRRIEILEPKWADEQPASQAADFATVRRSVMQIALFLYLGGMARRGADGIEVIKSGSNDRPYLTIKDKRGVLGSEAEGVIYTTKFIRDWVGTDENVRAGDPRLIVGWCRYLARYSTMFRLICDVQVADELSDADLGLAVIEGAKRVCAAPDKFVEVWTTEIGKGSPPQPALRPETKFLQDLQANPDFYPIMRHFGFQSGEARRQRKEPMRVESKPRGPRKGLKDNEDQ